MNLNPPEPDDYGLTTDNCGNLIAYIRLGCLDDMIGDMEAGDPSLALEIMKELQRHAAQNRNFNETNTETESVLEEIG